MAKTIASVVLLCATLITAAYWRLRTNEVEVAVENVGRHFGSAAMPMASIYEGFHVSFYDCKLYDKDIVSLSHDLRILDPVSLNLSGTMISDQSVGVVSELLRLKELDLSRTAITDKGISSLTALPELQRLNLSRTAVTGDCIKAVARIKQLKSLEVVAHGLREAALAELVECERLRDLRIAAELVSSRSCLHISGIKSLKCLCIVEGSIDATQVESLLTLGNLRMICLEKVNIAEGDYQKIVREMPETAIERM